MLPTNGGTPRNLTRDLRQQIGTVVRKSEGYTAWTTGNGEIIAVSTHYPARIKTGLCLIHLRDETIELVLEEDGAISTGRFRMDAAEPTGAIIYALYSATTPGDLWLLDVSSRSARQVTQINPQLPTGLFPEPQVIEWQTEEGEILGGLLQVAHPRPHWKAGSQWSPGYTPVCVRPRGFSGLTGFRRSSRPGATHSSDQTSPMTVTNPPRILREP